MVKNIDSDLIRGNIDTIILKTMLDGDKYGLDIIKEVESRSNGTYELKQPTLYSCLKRLENQELISSYWLDSDIGGKRHYYKLTEKGRDFFKQKQEEWSKSKFIIDNLLSNFDDDEYRLVKKDDYDKIIEGKTFDYDEHKVKEALKNYDATSSVAQNSEYEEDKSDEVTEEENTSDDDLGIDEYTSLLDDNDEQDDEQTIEEDENTDDEETYENETANEYNSPVYLSQETSNYETDSNDDEDNDQDLKVDDYILSEHEKNLLSKLRFHDDEEVNEYHGDKNSYINHLNFDEIHDNDEHDDDENEEQFASSNDENENLETLSKDDENETINYDSEKDETYDDLNFETDETDETSVDENQKTNEPENFDYSTNNESEFDDSEDEEQQNIDADDYTDEDDDLDNLVAVQQNLLDDPSLGETDDFETKVNEFSKAAHELQNFDSSGETTKKDEFDYNVPELQEYSSIKETENDKDDQTSPVSNEFDNIIYNNNLENSEPENSTFESQSSNVYNENQSNLKETSNFQKSDSKLDDDFFDDLEELKDRSQSSFEISEDNEAYGEREVDKKIENFTPSETFEPQNENAYNEYDTSNEDSGKFEEATNDEVSDYSENQNDDIFSGQADFSAFDNIITKNADTYSQSSMFSENDNHQLFVQTNDNQSEPAPAPENESLKKAKDINALKEEFELQGIKVKEFKKYSDREEAPNNYLLANKINLISSLILLFGYMFILSAVYIIMNNTGFATMVGFNYAYFAYGFIPFGIWAIYNLIKFIANPYKKIPAKYAPGVTIFISIIVTVQLLLITYCVNLQLGFYSFTQASYNHLLWIIPTILSFAPIISNLVYISLFYSKNFNV